jgi:NAD(P)-dependent dehydrogenase (short-subunit alcohol dehydrogenase family)
MLKVALVTGAGQSVGRGIAEVLAADGVSVAVNDLHPDRAESTARDIVAAGGQAVAVPFDVTDRAAIEAGVDRVKSELGPVDILVNNAGVVEGIATSPDRVPFLASDPDRWMPQYALNLFGSMHCVHVVAPGMVERGWGRIVQISSGAASTGLSNGMSLYASAKAGIEGLFRHVATELAPTGVTANVLALGMMANNGETGAPSETIDRLLSRQPMRRFGKPAEVGAAVRWLAGDDAGFVTGQVIHLNGGTLNGR